MSIVIGLGNSEEPTKWQDPLGLYGGKAPDLSAPAPQSAPSWADNDRDRNDIINTVIGEAAGEGDQGMAAVASVIRNRSNQRGLTPAQIVRQPDQFTAFSNPGSEVRREMTDPDLRARATSIVNSIFDGSTQDPTGGADHYHATSVSPDWAQTMPETTRVGNHIFYRSGKGPAPAPREKTNAIAYNGDFKDSLGLYGGNDPFAAILTPPDGQKPATEQAPAISDDDASKYLLSRLQPGHPSSYISLMKAPLRDGIAAMLQDAPDEVKNGVQIMSGARSPERQAQIIAENAHKYGIDREAWLSDVAAYGPVDAGKKWRPIFRETGMSKSIGAPGTSKHQLGVAADLGWNGGSLANAPKPVIDWLHANAARYNLRFPLANENWHIETADARSGQPAPEAKPATTDVANAGNSGQPASTIVADRSWKPSDPMGMYQDGNPILQSVQDQYAKQDADAASAAAQSEQNRIRALTDQHNAQVSDRLAELNKDNPGRYQVMDEGQVGDWQKKWDADNKSTGVLGDTKRMLVKGSAGFIQDLGSLADTIFPHIPGGEKFLQASDKIDQWIMGRTLQQKMQDVSDKNDATVTDEQKISDAKNWWDSENHRLGPAWSDPRSYLRVTAESAPSTIVTMLPGGIMARGVFVRGIAAGLTEREAAAAAAKTAAIAGGITEGLQAGGNSARTVRDRIAAIPREQLVQSEAVQQLVKGGLSEDDAVKAATQDAATQAMLVTGVLTGIFGGQGDRVLAKIIGEGISGNIAKRIAVGAAKGFVGEGLLEEAPQNVAQQISENAAVARVNPKQDLTEGVGEAVASGIAGGGAMGVGMGGAGGAVSRAHGHEAVQESTTDATTPAPAATATTPQTKAAGPIGRAVEHATTQATQRNAPKFVVDDGPMGDQPAGPLNGQTVTLAADQSNVPGYMRRVVASDGTVSTIGNGLLKTLDKPTPAKPAAPAAPDGAPEIGATVKVDHDGVDPFMARVDGYEGDEAILIDSGSGEIYQVPISSISQIAPSPETAQRNAEQAQAETAEPVTSPESDPALEPVPPKAAEVKTEPLPPRKEQKPATEAFPRAPGPGQSIIVDNQRAGRFVAKVKSWENGGTEALVTDSDGNDFQVPVSDLYVNKLTDRQVEEQDLQRNPPVEREIGDSGPNSRKVFGKTVVLPDERHARLYDLAKERFVSRKAGGNSQLDLGRVNSPELQKLANDFGISEADLGAMADDYRYRVDRSAKEARTALPINMAQVNERRLKQWQSKNAETAPLPDDMGHWWDVALSDQQRKAILSQAGVKRSEKMMWGGFTPNLQKKLAGLRPAESVGDTANAVPEPAQENARIVDTETANGDSSAASPVSTNPDITIEQRENDILLKRKDGAAHLSVKPVGNDLKIGIASTSKAVRGQGKTRALYEEAIRLAGERGGVLRSDMVVSHDATHVYDALRRRGYEVERNPKVSEGHRGLISPTVAPDNWVFKVKPKPEAVDSAAHEAATSPHNDLPQPTQAQKEAGNYQKGHIRLGGLDISIENPAGSDRSGTDAGGKPWSVEMKSHYGYIRGTVGKDKDHIDVFVKPGTEQIADDAPVFVVDQKQANRFDEHKVMLGFATKEEAKAAYLANYSKGWQGLGQITESTLGEFKGWLQSGKTQSPYINTMAKPPSAPAQDAPVVDKYQQVKDLFSDYPIKDLADKSLPKEVFHGTSQGGFHQFDPYRGEYGLMGSGSYFTENPNIAVDYTKKGKGKNPTLYSAKVDIKNPLDMDAPADVAAWRKAFDDYLDDYNHEGKPRTYEGYTNEQMYREVEENLSGEMIPLYEGAEMMQDGVRSMGHDGITHIGGGRVKSDSTKHRVWIAFDPEQVEMDGRWPIDGKNAPPAAEKASDRVATHDSLAEEGDEADFVHTSDGSTDFGNITPEIGEAIGRQPAPIRLRRGNSAWGLNHIEARHGDQIRALGYDDVPGFVQSVARNFTSIYKREGRSLDVVLEDGKNGKLIVQLEPSTEGDFYDVKTATPTRSDQFKNRQPLWERTGPSSSSAKTDLLNPESPSGSSGNGARTVTAASMPSDDRRRTGTTANIEDSSGDVQASANESLQAIVDDAKAENVKIAASDRNRNGDSVISLIDTTAAGRGGGLGSKYMNRLAEWADRTGTRLLLSPSTDFGASSRTRLSKFYQRFGFVENKGRGRDLSISETMYRDPRREVPEASRTPAKTPDAKIKGSPNNMVDLVPPERPEGTSIGSWAAGQVLSIGTKTGHEYMMAIDSDGEVVGYGTSGQPRDTGLNDRILSAMANPARQLVIYHNHPFNGAASIQDIAMLMMPGIHAVYSLGHKGLDMRIELTPSARGVRLSDDLVTSIDMLRSGMEVWRNKIAKFLQSEVDKGTITPDEAKIAHGRLAVLLAERANIIDFKTNVQYDPTSIAGLDQQITDAAQKLAKDFFNDPAAAARNSGVRRPAISMGHIADLEELGEGGQLLEGRRPGPSGLSEGSAPDYRRKEPEGRKIGDDEVLPSVSERSIISKVQQSLDGNWTDIQPKLLATVPLNYFPELAHGKIPAIADYLHVKRSMDAFRGQKHDESVKIIDQWRKLISKGYVFTDQSRASQIADLMHETTLAGVDPSLTTPEEQAKPGYAALRKRFTELPPIAKELYTTVRDAYRKQADETDALLLDNVRKAQQIALNRAEAAYRAKLDDIRSADMEEPARRRALEDAESKYKADSTKARWAAKARMTKLRLSFENSRVEAPYFPLARFGRYFVTAKDIDGKVLHFSKHEKQIDQRQAIDGVRRALPNAKIESGVMEESGDLRRAMDPRVVAELETMLGDAGVDDTIRDALWQRYLETMPDLSTRKNFIHRKGTAGYNRDAFRVFASNQFHAAHQMARLKYGLELQELVNDAADQAKAIDDNTREMTLVNEFIKRDKWVRNPTGAAFTNWINSVAFTWYLAASPAAAMVNATQTIMLGIPLLGAKFGIGKSSSALMRASKDFASGRADLMRANLTADERAAMNAFYESGLIDRTQSHDLAAVGETGTKYNPVRAKVMNAMSWAFHNVEVFNRSITALAAYRLGREAGQDHLQAINMAHERTYAIHFDMSNSSRARVLQNDTAKALFVFRSYQINMLYRLARDLHQSIKGESPQVRKEARIQFAGVMGMMATMAGVTGVPGYGLAMAASRIFSKIFGDDDDDPIDIEDRFKNGVKSILGPELGDIVLGGAPGHYLGIDLTSRIGMPDLWFRSPNKDLQGREEWQYYVLNSLGASVSMIGDMFEGFKVATDENNVARGIETAAPKFVRDLMKSFRYAWEGVQSRNGDEVMSRDELSAYDLAAQFIGFTPSKISDRFEDNNALKTAERRIMDRRKTIINAFTQAVALGNDDARKAALERVKTFNSNPLNASMAITSKTLKSSLATRAKNKARREDGVLIQNKKLGAQLRSELQGSPDDGADE